MRLIDADALKFRDVKVTTNEIDIFGFGDYIVEERKGILQEEIWNAPTIDVEPHWIPCKERLPKEYGLYLATMNDGFVQECSYVPTDYGDVLLNGWSTCEASGFKVLNETDVLAWMPLPEPYTKRKDNE